MHGGQGHILTEIDSNLLAKDAISLRIYLEKMGHPQLFTPIQVDNTTAVSFANSHLKQKAIKAIDMQFYWIRDRVNQNIFHIYWGPGTRNSAYYVSENHSPNHHRNMRPTFLTNRPPMY